MTIWYLFKRFLQLSKSTWITYFCLLFLDLLLIFLWSSRNSLVPVLSGITLVNLLNNPNSFPLTWLWFIISPMFILAPIINDQVTSGIELIFIRLSTRINYWAAEWCAVSFLLIIQWTILLAAMSIQHSIKIIFPTIIITTGSIVTSFFWILCSKFVTSKVAFVLAFLFPLIGITSHNTVLPTNWLMPIRLVSDSHGVFMFIFLPIIYTLVISLSDYLIFRNRDIL